MKAEEARKIANQYSTEEYKLYRAYSLLKPYYEYFKNQAEVGLFTAEVDNIPEDIFYKVKTLLEEKGYIVIECLSVSLGCKAAVINWE